MLLLKHPPGYLVQTHAAALSLRSFLLRLDLRSFLFPDLSDQRVEDVVHKVPQSCGGLKEGTVELSSQRMTFFRLHLEMRETQ